MTPADFLAYVMVALFGMAPVVVSAFLIRLRDREQMAFWSRAAREAGLSAIEPRRGLLEARSGPLEVRIRSYQSDDTAGTRVEVWGPRLAPGLTLRPEGEGTTLGRRDRKEIEIGDEAFDNVVSVHGPSALALALLDPVVRGAVASLMRGRLSLPAHRQFWASGRFEHGVLRIDVPEEVRPRQSHYSAAELFPGRRAAPTGKQAGAAGRAARVARPRRSPRGPRTPRRSARLEPTGRAGGRCEAQDARRCCSGSSRKPPATQAAARATLDDPDADVRLQAAVALGSDGHDVLLRLAGGEGAADATNARAVAALGASLTLAEAQDLLRRALRTRRLLTAKACLSLLGQLGGAEAAQTLAKVLLVEKHELGEAAAAGARGHSRPCGGSGALACARRRSDRGEARGRRRAGPGRHAGRRAAAASRRARRRAAQTPARPSPRSIRGWPAPSRASSRSPKAKPAGCRSRKARPAG